MYIGMTKMEMIYPHSEGVYDVLLAFHVSDSKIGSLRNVSSVLYFKTVFNEENTTEYIVLTPVSAFAFHLSIDTLSYDSLYNPCNLRTLKGVCIHSTVLCSNPP